MDKAVLWANRNRLVEWQKGRYARPKEGTRLNLGSGHGKYPGYINIDKYTDEADVKSDISRLEYIDNSVDEISSHHSLEHLPLAAIEPTLREWFRVLKPGGQLDLGMPDVELCMQDYLGASDEQKQSHFILPIYGSQDGPGMFHLSGITTRDLLKSLRQIGFKIVDWFNYDANTWASSVWVLAEKPTVAEKWIPTVLEQDVAMGVFTHRTTFLPPLMDSVKKYLPHIQFITQIADLPINGNMEALRQKFIASGKRYWIFLDDDIRFLNPSIVHDAVSDMLRNGWAGCGVYSTFDPEWNKNGYNPNGLQAHEIGWVPGYFIMVDSQLVGHIQPDLNLPDANTSIDTSYCVSIRAAGHRIGISPNVVYHTMKGVKLDEHAWRITNDYLMKKWGDFYFNTCTRINNVVGNVPAVTETYSYKG